MVFSAGDTAFVIASTGGVIMMTLPGLILYYAGMVRVQMVLTTVRLVVAIFATITLCWFSFGYSLAFGPRITHRGDSTPIYGDATRLWLRGMTMTTFHENAPMVPESIYCLFQLAFAIVTSTLVVGSFADRVRFGPVMLFVVLWHFVVYCPIAHAVWHPDGFLFQAGVMDYAGGNVVHISSGCSALVACAIVGNNYGFARDRFAPHNVLLTFMGVSLLYVGWLGFNGGNALNATDGVAAMAVLNTIIGSSASSISWAFVDAALERDIRTDMQFLGMMNGLIAGLVAITPACGFVDSNGAFWIGTLGGIGCNLSAKLKTKFGWGASLVALHCAASSAPPFPPPPPRPPSLSLTLPPPHSLTHPLTHPLPQTTLSTRLASTQRAAPLAPSSRASSPSRPTPRAAGVSSTRACRPAARSWAFKSTPWWSAPPGPSLPPC